MSPQIPSRRHAAGRHDCRTDPVRTPARTGGRLCLRAGPSSGTDRGDHFPRRACRHGAAILAQPRHAVEPVEPPHRRAARGLFLPPAAGGYSRPARRRSDFACWSSERWKPFSAASRRVLAFPCCQRRWLVPSCDTAGFRSMRCRRARRWWRPSSFVAATAIYPARCRLFCSRSDRRHRLVEAANERRLKITRSRHTPRRAFRRHRR